MVNVGGPSKGCVTCIRRKIRCDRQRPVCSQCQKSRRRCEGYRNETDTMFRDQSQSVFARAHAASQSQSRPLERTANLEAPNVPHSNVADRDWPVSYVTSVIHSPRLNAKSGLVTFFTNNFVCTSSNRGSNLFWVPNNFDDLLKNDMAKLSVKSVGSMALARLQRSSYYDQKAQRDYGSALSNLGNLWRQSAEIDKDVVLITILFLSFFEILASYDSSSRQSWTTHLGGLGVLLKRRRDEFFATDFGARIMLQSRSQVILNALQTGTPVPEAFHSPKHGIQHTMSSNVAQSDKADMLLIRLATLQAQYRSSGPSNTLIADLAILYGDLCQWTEFVHSSWSFSTQPSELHSDLWWEARCDVYSTAVMAHVWNKIRAAQIVVYDLTQEISSRMSSCGEDAASLAVGQTSHEILAPEIQRLVTDICATVPIYYRPSSATTGAGAVENRPLLGTTYWLLWPLEVVGSMREAPTPLKTWILQCLRRIHDITGIAKAKAIADRVETRHRSAFVA